MRLLPKNLSLFLTSSSSQPVAEEERVRKGNHCPLQTVFPLPAVESSPINQIYYFMFIFFLFTSGVFWKSIHFEVASDSFSLLINSSWLLVFAIILFVPYGHIFCIGFYFAGFY